MTSGYVKHQLDGLKQVVFAVHLMHSERQQQQKDTVKQCRTSLGKYSRMYHQAQCLQLLMCEYISVCSTLACL